MKNSVLAVMGLVLVITSFAPARGEDQAVMPTDNQPPRFMEEAARATLGRVFGVAGEGGNIEYHSLDLSHHSPGNAALRSTLVPGWGQGFNGQRTKGALIFMTAAAAAIGSVRLYHKSGQTYDDYQATGVKDSSLYDDYTRQKTQSLVLGSAAVILWGYSIYDAYRNAYSPLWSRKDGVELSFSLDGGTLRARKYF